MQTTRRNRQTGTVLMVDTAENQGLDEDAGKWVTICVDHGTILNSATRALAEATYPLDFCDHCRRAAGQDFGEYVNGLLDRDLVAGMSA